MSRPRRHYVATKHPPIQQGPRLGPRRWAYHRPVEPRSTAGVFLRRLAAAGLILALLGVAFTLGYKLWVDAQTGALIYSAGDATIPENKVALVFGAGLTRSGGPSAVLRDRVQTAVDLFAAGKVKKLLMTGDNSTQDHNEVEAMRQVALAAGVPDADIVLDYAGFNTWDSCYRAREVFSITEATLVTQRFHLPRALYTCRELGIKVVGVEADRSRYRTSYNEAREYLALVGTAIRVLTNDKPRFLGPKVNIDEPQER